MGTHTQLQLDMDGTVWQAQGPSDFQHQPGAMISVQLPEKHIWLLPI
jgi:hypothetical protein